MDLFEKINRAFGGWYEGLFGSSDDVRPRDILRRIIIALEEGRKEGIDGKTYVPNQYILEIAIDDEEEKEYLLSFLDRDELEAAIRQYCKQNGYNIRNNLDFTIKEVDKNPAIRRKDKVRVRCRYDSRVQARATPPQPAPLPLIADAIQKSEQFEDRTVPDIAAEYAGEEGTIPAVSNASLSIVRANRAPVEYIISHGVVTIGRSPRAGNDIVLDDDGLVSRRHARIEMDADGRFTLYDLNTTNGTKVNSRKIENRILNNSDEIAIGATRLIFHCDQESAASDAPKRAWREVGRVESEVRRNASRLVLTDGVKDIDDFILGTETLVGRGLTNDIVLSDRSVAIKHARIKRGDPSTLESLDASSITRINSIPLASDSPAPLKNGDIVEIGNIALRYEEEKP